MSTFCDIACLSFIIIKFVYNLNFWSTLIFLFYLEIIHVQEFGKDNEWPFFGMELMCDKIVFLWGKLVLIKFYPFFLRKEGSVGSFKILVSSFIVLFHYAPMFFVFFFFSFLIFEKYASVLFKKPLHHCLLSLYIIVWLDLLTFGLNNLFSILGFHLLVNST